MNDAIMLCYNAIHCEETKAFFSGSIIAKARSHETASISRAKQIVQLWG
jgi:hypothetical protein